MSHVHCCKAGDLRCFIRGVVPERMCERCSLTFQQRNLEEDLGAVAAKMVALDQVEEEETARRYSQARATTSDDPKSRSASESEEAEEKPEKKRPRSSFRQVIADGPKGDDNEDVVIDVPDSSQEQATL